MVKVTTATRLKQVMSERNLKQIDIIRMSEPFQKELGIKMGKSTFSQYVNGIQSPDQDRIFLLSKTLDVNEPWLMGFDVIKERTSDKERNEQKTILTIYNQLTKNRQAKVYDFASYQLKEQHSKISYLYGYISAGTGEFMEETQKEEIQIPENAPAHDFVLKVNGDSMEPLFDNGEYIYIKSTSVARDGQIIACMIDNEAFVKKLSGNRLVSLNKKYKDIEIHEYEDFKIFGVVVL